MDVLVGILGLSFATLLVIVFRARRARASRARPSVPPPPPPPTVRSRRSTLPGLGPERARIQAHVARAIQRTGPMPSGPRRKPHTPAYGLARRIASKLTEDLVVDATDEDLSGVTFQLDELSDESLLEISRLLEIEPPPIEQVDARPDFDDEADTILRATPPVVTRASMRRFGTPTPTPTPV